MQHFAGTERHSIRASLRPEAEYGCLSDLFDAASTRALRQSGIDFVPTEPVGMAFVGVNILSVRFISH